MPRKSVNFYGYDKETYDSCQALICNTNRRHMEILHVWFLLLNVLYVFLAQFELFGVSKRFQQTYLIYLLIGAAFEAVIRFVPKAFEKVCRLMILLSIAILVSYGIFSSLTQPYMAALMFHVLLVIIGISYIDTLSLMTGVLMLSCILFLFSSFRMKSYSVAYQDLFHAFVFLGLALILHYSFQHIRMHQFETYQKNIQIQRELEVKSCFDGLTGMLNRARFFSLADEVLHSSHEEYTALCMMDLDGFKQINDKLGHQIGDKALQIAGTTVLHAVDADMSDKWSLPERIIRYKKSFAGRLGGDEFIILFRGFSGREHLVTVLQNMLLGLNQVKFGELHGIFASIGVVEIDADEKDIDHAYLQADEALYTSKKAGKNQITFSGQSTGGKA